LDNFEVVIENTAEKDLVGILNYIFGTLLEPESARRVYASLKTQISSLEQFPYRYPTISEEPYATMNVRKIPVENYLTFYIVDDERKKVHVFRILHNRREWQHML
jgi:toxin ParE1/3/4